MISVIIPTYNEEENIRRTITSIASLAEHEVIVMDGGSQDRTVDIARSMGIKTIVTPPGRALQMNVGADNSSGNILLFLHGDSALPSDFAISVETTLAQAKTGAGAFGLRIDLSGLWPRIIEKMVVWRSLIFQLPYGDQAIFVTRALFEEVGGYDEEVFLEDYLFVRKIRRFGRIRLASSAGVLTSGRRWQRLGFLKTTLINQAVILGYLLGFSIPTLKKLYGVAKKG